MSQPAPTPISAPGSLRAFAGAAALVTGGASGLGCALAKALAARGADVVLADRQVELAREVAAAIVAGGGRATAVELDVTDPAAVERVVRETRARCGRLDYLFNNAGIGIGGEVRYHQLDDWNAIIDVNLRGVIYGIQAAYPIMIEQGFGHIVSTASMAAFLTVPFTAAYGMTKSAVVALSKALRVEAREYGVRVSALCPGVIRTPILEGGKFGRFVQEIPRDHARAAWERLRPMDPDRFAVRVLKAVERDTPIIIVPRWWRLFWWIGRLSTALDLWAAAWGYRQVKKELRRGEEARKGANAPATPGESRVEP